MFNIPFYKGHFEWNSQTNGLELISDAERPSLAESAEKKNKKSRHGLNVPGIKVQSAPKEKHEIGLPNKALRGLLSPAGNPGITLRVNGPISRVSPKLGFRGDRTTVALDDIKAVTLAELTRERLQSGQLVSNSFKALVYKQQLDHFLITLLRYFNCFFNEDEHHEELFKTSFLEPSKAEVRKMEETEQKMTTIKRRLGQAYCVLLLGIGIEKQHHMGCGKKRVSCTHRDKKMFEDLYWFCTTFVYITFRRRDLDRIRMEIGDMLRSPIFNPAMRPPKKPPSEKPAFPIKPYVKDSLKPVGERVAELLAVKLPNLDKTSPAEHRRRQGKRPAIMRAIHQRSTALISILPSPQESAEYLFKSSIDLRKHSIKNHKKRGKGFDPFNKQLFESEKIGIIGEPFEFFNADNLVPKNMDGDEDTYSRTSGDKYSLKPKPSVRLHDHSALMPGSLSRATTEASINSQMSLRL